MPLQIIRNDITKVPCDAIVNAANRGLLGGGGVDGAIHRAAGPELLEECRKLGGCRVGEAKITRGYALPAKYVIHTVGPVWNGGNSGEKERLESCYRSSLALAKKYKCQTVAFPLISSGVYGYPKAEALKVAVDVISRFLLENDMTVFIVVFDRAAYLISEKLYCDIRSFIDDNYVDLYGDLRERRMRKLQRPQSHLLRSDAESEHTESRLRRSSRPKVGELWGSEASPMGLEDALQHIDESFTQMLLRKIDEKGMTDSQCYKKANVDRKLFSKIRSDIHYHPSKTTAIAFAIALELDL